MNFRKWIRAAPETRDEIHVLGTGGGYFSSRENSLHVAHETRTSDR